MIILRIPTLILLFCVCQLVQAQKSYNYFNHLTVESGLSETTNGNVYKDSRGFVWISSLSGLNRYDGRQVKVYQYDPSNSSSIYGQNIQSKFYEDKNGDIWFSTYEGLNKYVRKYDTFKHYIIKDSLPGNPISGYNVAYLDNFNKLWILVNEKSIYTFDTKTEKFEQKHELKSPRQNLVILTDSLNKVIRSFAYTWNAGYRGMQMTEYLDGILTGEEILFDEASAYPINIQDILFDNNNVWLASGTGLYVFDPNIKSIELKIAGKQITSINKLNPTEFLLTTLNEGLYTYNQSTHALYSNLRYTSSSTHTLSTNNVLNACIDHDNGVWIQAKGIGLNFNVPEKSKFNQIYSFPTWQVLRSSYNSTALTVDNDNNLWIGSPSDGIRYINLKNFKVDSFKAKTASAKGLVTNSTVQCFKDVKQRTWFLTFNSLYFYNVQKKLFEVLKGVNTLFLYGLVTKNGKTLIATFDGVYELKESSKDNFKLEFIDKIPHDKPHPILFEDTEGLIWASYDAVTVRVYNPNNNYEMVKEIPISGVISGFWHQPNTSTIWISSHNGLYKVDKENGQFRQFTQMNGLPSRTINSMITDDSNRLWLGTSKGLAQFDVNTEGVNAYNLADDISDLNFNLYAVTKSNDGTIYLGTSNGVTAFHPNNIHPLSVQAHPAITDILINDQSSQNLSCSLTNAKNVSEIQSLILPYAQNTISFTFAPLEYSDPMRCLFKYKMDGIDNDWVNSGGQNFARYANLKPGSYTFHIRATNSDGIWSPESKSIKITITPPFWRTWWFITLSTVFVLSVIGYIIFLRVSKTLELQKTKLKLYENLHDDVGSRLTAIVLSVDELMMRNKEKDSRLQLISDISRGIVANMRRLVWATAPENDALENVVQKMQADRRTLLSENIIFKLNINPNLLKLAIDGDKRYQMSAIFNEALTNIAKYAEATIVETSIEKVGDMLVLTIKDNGKGFDTQQPVEEKNNSSGYGLKNMQRRANRMKGAVKIVSKVGEGTLVEVTFPLLDKTFKEKIKSIFKISG